MKQEILVVAIPDDKANGFELSDLPEYIMVNLDLQHGERIVSLSHAIRKVTNPNVEAEEFYEVIVVIEKP